MLLYFTMPAPGRSFARPCLPAAHSPSRALAGRKARAIAGQEFLLFFIGATALREERTRISPLSPFISSLKNKARLEEPVRAGKSPLSACFFTVLPARARANSLLCVSLGKERRKSCPLFPCVPKLDPKEGIDAGTPQHRRVQAAVPRRQAATASCLATVARAFLLSCPDSGNTASVTGIY